jgi:hypothetical protein
VSDVDETRIFAKNDEHAMLDVVRNLLEYLKTVYTFYTDLTDEQKSGATVAEFEDLLQKAEGSVRKHIAVPPAT